MDEQIRQMRRLRAEHVKLRQVAELIWPRIPKQDRDNQLVAKLSPAMIMQTPLVDADYIAGEHSVTLALQYLNVHGLSPSVFLFCYHYVTLADIKLAFAYNPQTRTYQIPDHVLEALSWHSAMSLDLYEYLVRHGHQVARILHAIYAPKRLNNAGTQHFYVSDRGGMKIPTSFTRLKKARRNAIMASALTNAYLHMSLTEPIDLMQAGYRQHLTKHYMMEYFSNRNFSIAHKLQSATWMTKIPLTGAFFSTQPHPRWVIEPHRAVTGSNVHYLTLKTAIKAITSMISWIDYTDYLLLQTAAVSVGYELEIPAMKVVGAPVSWWRQQSKADIDASRLKIAIERGLPNIVDEIIATLPTTSGIGTLQSALTAYKHIRACHTRRLVNAIAHRWRSLIKHH